MSSIEIKPMKETGEHSYHRRSHNHDYYAPFIYHLILKKAAVCESFGSVTGDARISPGQPGCARIDESLLGKTIAKAMLRLPYEFPILRLHQFCVMPDHIHLLVQVLYKSDRHLDFYVQSLIARIASRYSEKIGRKITDEEIFEPGYCDKPLYENRSLPALYQYIRENPHRLAMRMQFPDFFRRARKFKIGENEYEAYGNLFLMRNPDKEAVKVSSRFTAEEKRQNKARWLSAAAKGTILVSPFISQEEKAIRIEAEDLGARLILITHEAFSDRFKPSAHDFELCEQGRLLIISLGLPAGTALARTHCLAMNALAALIATSDKPAPRPAAPT